jgi:ApbE superfamily uncharacterized protein (UPF0280 family)
MEPLTIIRDDLVLVDWGPMTLTVSAWAEGEARPVMAARAGVVALDTLRRLADFQFFVKIPVSRLPDRGRRPAAVVRATEAARAVAQVAGVDLTPLAAVAGAVADEVADAAVRFGADRVVVNNGGDVAVRLGPGQEVTVGLPAAPGARRGQRLRIEYGQGIGGVATSGWQGRSFSPGVADQVSVWGESAALADATATALAALTDVDAAGVRRLPARALDPDTDLGATPVTVGVDALSRRDASLALSRGEAAARRIMSRLAIRGVLIRVGRAQRVIRRSPGWTEALDQDKSPEPILSGRPHFFNSRAGLARSVRPVQPSGLTGRGGLPAGPKTLSIEAENGMILVN